VTATPLPCEEILFRFITSRRCLDPDTKKIKAEAYLRRERDTDGLSVYIASRTDLEKRLSAWKTTFGVDSLHTGRVRTLGLDVVQKAADPPDHALIVGLPLPSENLALAERLAGALASMSRAVDRKVRRRRKD